MVGNIRQLLNTISEFMDKNRFEVDIMSEALDYINDNFNKDINLSFISNKFNLSYSYFSRIFKMYAGVSFTQYLLKVRMEKAKELLVSSPNLKIKEVASMVGYDFDNVQNFTRAFKNYFGKSPQYYKD
jgi:two-component system response regulator YesN